MRLRATHVDNRASARTAATLRRLAVGWAALQLASACGGSSPLAEDDPGNASAGSGGTSTDPGASGGSSSGGTSAMPATGMQVLQEGEDDPSVIALDDRFVYWVSRAGLRQAPLDGGPPVLLVGLEYIRAIVPFGDHVYFAQSSSEDGQIARVPRAGGEVERIATSPAARDLAIADGYVYWTDPGFSINTGQLLRAPLGGGAAELLAESLPEPSDIALAADHVYFSSSGQSCSAFSEEGASCIGGGIHRVPQAGGAPEPVVAEHSVSNFWLDASGLYWFASSPPRLMFATPFGAARELAVVLADGTGPLISDGEALYWGSADKVLRLPFGSEAVTRLASNLASPSSVAVRGDWVYVAEAAGGRILRVATDGSANRYSGPITGPCPEPLGALEELALTPRADTNLEQLALSLEPGNVVASQATYDRVVADIAAIRALAPDRADIDYFAPDDGKTVYLGLTDVAAQTLLAGEYSAWDCLNERYGASVAEPREALSGDWSLLITLRGIYNLPRIAERYAELPGVTATSGNSTIGDGPTLCAARDGESYQYVIDRAGGDCPAGCTEHDARAFSSEVAGQITAVGAWNSASGEPAPAWFGICR